MHEEYKHSHEMTRFWVRITIWSTLHELFGAPDHLEGRSLNRQCIGSITATNLKSSINAISTELLKCTQLRTHIYTRINKYTCVHTHIYTCTHANPHTCMQTHTHINIHLYAHIYTNIHIHTHKHTIIQTHPHAYITHA